MIKRWLVYILSLPERLLRALASVVGGTALVLLETLVPTGFKGMTIYRILIGDGLRFLVERIAGIPSLGLPVLPADYQRRKFIGSAIEGLGLITVQFSPLWVFAIAADADQPNALIAKLAGIAPFFHLYDVGGNLVEVMPNPHLDMEYGIGPACAGTLADMGVTVLVARKIPGPKMDDVLKARQIRIVRRLGTVEDVVMELRE